MIPPVAFGSIPARPFTTATQAAPARFGGGDVFVRFGSSDDDWNPDDPRFADELYSGNFHDGLLDGQELDPDDAIDADMLEKIRRAMRDDMDVVISTMEDLDTRFYAAMDEGDCDKARACMSLKKQVEDALMDDLPDDLSQLVAPDDLDARIEASLQAYHDEQTLKKIEWTTFLNESGFAEEEGPNLNDERRAASRSLAELDAAVEKALQEHRDEDALALYKEFKAMRDERNSLGYDG